MAGMNTKWRTRTERMCVWRADEARGGPVERKVNVWRARALQILFSPSESRGHYSEWLNCELTKNWYIFLIN